MKKRNRAVITKTYARKSIKELIYVGGCLSNIAFNSKQRNDVPMDIRKHCEEYQKKWDAVMNNLPQYLKRD